MAVDPVAVMVSFLRSLSIPVTGDLNTREVGQTVVYVRPGGGPRILRDVLDRADLFYEVYMSGDAEKEDCAQLALEVREAVLRQMPNSAVAGAFVLDTDADFPEYEPDASSREHMYAGSLSLWITTP
ncbi:hypothetical protein [Streptomyces sp. NPDC002644]